MKRRELIQKLLDAGCIFIRAGAKHDLYMNPRTQARQPVPRHREIDENLAKHILKVLVE
jgi:mRNA interferase HicA